MNDALFVATHEAATGGAAWRRHLDLLWVLVRRELKVKYRGSFLGYLWSMLNPLLNMAVISIVFSFLVRGIPNYPVYVLSGLLFWTWVGSSIAIGTQSIVNGAGLIKKVRMPVWIFPLVPVLTFAINLMLALLPFVVIYLVMDVPGTPQIWLFPIICVLFLVFLTGITLVLATMNVFFRDVGHVIEPALQMMFYATPVIYARDHPMIPERVAYLLGFNPFTHFIEVGRASIFPASQPVGVMDLLLVTALAAASLLVGIVVYRRARLRFIFEL